MKKPQEVKFFAVEDGRTYELMLDDSGRALVTTQDILLGPGMTAQVEAPYTFLPPEDHLLLTSPGYRIPTVRVAPGIIREQRQGPFWLVNSGESAVAIPAGTQVVLFSLSRDVWFDTTEVTL
ncbi:hypothetical protein LCGC14_0461700 [marine sediment metagenome]|uniref:Uncharacterized protein n=1 Tax=marine sediment metagenome TaxID=412755 RepID=A0A0F9SXS6_9ZZZZ